MLPGSPGTPSPVLLGPPLPLSTPGELGFICCAVCCARCGEEGEQRMGKMQGAVLGMWAGED